jgi:hypothetical protein
LGAFYKAERRCDRALYYFRITNPIDGRGEAIINLLQYDEVVDGTSRHHGPFVALNMCDVTRIKSATLEKNSGMVWQRLL